MGSEIMLATGRKKIIKPVGQVPDAFEELVAQELFNLEVGALEIKEQLRSLYITAAKQIDISGGSKAIIVFVPFRQLKIPRDSRQARSRVGEKAEWSTRRHHCPAHHPQQELQT